jgi:hypothetical protein
MTGLREDYGSTSLSPSALSEGWGLVLKESAGGAGDLGSAGGTAGPGGSLGGKFSDHHTYVTYQNIYELLYKDELRILDPFFFWGVLLFYFLLLV